MLAVAMFFAAGAGFSVAHAEMRSLKLYFVHTGEHATITFKRNGRFDPRGLAKLNRFLRDWRRNEPTKMDPRLFDLIWTVYKKSGASGYINVLCGYRAPATNEMLRTRSRHTGVAKKSQHILGKAMDFYIPGVPLEKLREIGLKLQMGGVGYYPRSGSPFVHMDVGGVRAWPRPSRAVLARLFPDGKTMHIPPDGRPLPGYQAALADYKRRMGKENSEVASISSSSGGKRKNLFQLIFGGGGDEDEEPDAIVADAKPASKRQSATTQVASAEPPKSSQAYIENLPGVGQAPLPTVRPALKEPDAPAQGAIETAMASPARNSAQDTVSSVTPESDQQTQEFADLQQYKIPVPELLGNRRLRGEADLQVADVPMPDERPEYRMAYAAGVAAKVQEEQRTGQTVAAAPKDDLAELLQEIAANGQLNADQSVKPAAKPQVLASIAPAADAHKPLTRSLAVSTNAHQAQKALSRPKKGGRPSVADAKAASRMGVLKAPTLTGRLIEQWALSGNKVALAPRPQQPVEFHNVALTEKPATVYTAGFSTRTANIDPARFSGSAVNFLSVEKFKTE